jgi:hypothetical protein
VLSADDDPARVALRKFVNRHCFRLGEPAVNLSSEPGVDGLASLPLLLRRSPCTATTTPRRPFELTSKRRRGFP